MIELMKNFEMHITGVRGFNEAIVTRGGVNVKEINPSTMESKKVKHLFCRRNDGFRCCHRRL